MAMEIPTKALLVTKGTPSRAMVPRAENIQTMQEVLSRFSVTMDYAQSGIIRVQYNPSSLSTRAHVQSIKVNSMQKPGETVGVRREEGLPPIELSVKLVFTVVNSKNVFMADEFRLSTSDTMLDGVAITKAASGGYTVRPQIDRLMGVIMDMDTRGVAFVRQDMAFEGQVSSLRSSYNMFNTSGSLIDGSIDMSTTQNINEASATAWDKVLDKCFVSRVAGKNPLGKAGNPIDLDL